VTVPKDANQKGRGFELKRSWATRWLASGAGKPIDPEAASVTVAAKSSGVSSEQEDWDRSCLARMTRNLKRMGIVSETKIF
jgi:hypothetical protein